MMKSQLTEKQQKLYREALRCTDDPKLKSIIESLIREEKKHEETLMKLYAEIRKTGEFKDEG